VTRIGNASIKFAYACHIQENGELLADGSVTIVAVGDDGEPTHVPDDFQTAVSEFQDVLPE